MPIRNARPISWRPKGLTDSTDGTNSFAGAMKTLQNVIPDHANTDVFVPRPAAIRQTNFPGIAGAGFISAELVIGDIVYGMVASSATSGFDEPYAYDLANGVFLTVSGITSANVPASPPTSGFWTPPIMAQVAGRIIVTHPGFPGGDLSFGWFDVSNAVLLVSGDTISGSRYIFGNPSLLAVQVGMTVTGTGIPAGTTVAGVFAYPEVVDIVGDSHGTNVIDNIIVATNPGSGSVFGMSVAGPGIQAGTRVDIITVVAGVESLTLSQPTTSSVTAGTFTFYGDNSLGAPYPQTFNIDTIAASVNFAAHNAPYTIGVGQTISAPGIPIGTTIATYNRGADTGTLSVEATANNTNAPAFLVGAAIRLSANTTATNDALTFTVEGGTPLAPLWGAGNTDHFPLPSVPVGVAQMNGRAWYALEKNGIVYSDSDLPCSVSNSLAVQALTTNDGLGITAIAPLLLSAPITGGIVQALIAFEEDIKMQQITGDQVTGNLAMNVLPVATGTHSPLSIVPCESGLAFISPTGLRFVTFNGTVTAPVGAYGQGIVEPFMHAVELSRVCAAANAGVLRITTQNRLAEGFQEYWFDLARQIWHGPHTFPASLIQPWRTSFLLAPVGIEHSLWQSDSYHTATTVFVENEEQMLWVEETVLLPDNAVMAMNAMVQASIMFSLTPPLAIEVMALDEDRGIIDQAFAQGIASAMRQRSLNWSEPVVFKQMTLLAKGQSDGSLRLGNLYLGIAPVNYLNDGGRPNLVKVDSMGVVVP